MKDTQRPIDILLKHLENLNRASLSEKDITVLKLMGLPCITVKKDGKRKGEKIKAQGSSQDIKIADIKKCHYSLLFTSVQRAQWVTCIYIDLDYEKRLRHAQGL